MSSTTSTSKRKPFSIGARVFRQVDGERGAVESVEAFSVDGQPCWAVGVRMDSDGDVWSGTQSTATRGAWKKVPADDADASFSEVEQEEQEEQRAQLAAEKHELSTEELLPTAAEAVAALDATADAIIAATDAESAQESWDAQEEQERANVSQKRSQSFVCTFVECVTHEKTPDERARLVHAQLSK